LGVLGRCGVHGSWGFFVALLRSCAREREEGGEVGGEADGIEADPQGAQGPAEGSSHLLQRR